MKDTIITNTGNSRDLKSSIPATTTWEEARTMLRNGTFPVDIKTLNPVGVTQFGTPLSKTNILPDDLAAAMDVTPEGTLATFLWQLVRRSLIIQSTSVTDFDEMTDSGIYWVSLNSASHGPASATGSGYLMVFNLGATLACQVLIIRTKSIWIRGLDTGTWGEWIGMATDQDLATSSANGLMTAADKAAFDTSVMQGRLAGSTASLDDLRKGGTYWVATTSQTPGQIAGWPTNETVTPRYGLLTVNVSGATIVSQSLMMYNNVGMYRTYTRMYANGQWYPWNSITADSGEISLTNSHKASGVNILNGTFRKVGKCVHCDFDAQYSAALSAASLIDIFTLPSGYRPPSIKDFVGRIDTKAVRVTVLTDGTVCFNTDKDYSSGLLIFGNLEFFTD